MPFLQFLTAYWMAFVFQTCALYLGLAARDPVAAARSIDVTGFPQLELEDAVLYVAFVDAATPALLLAPALFMISRIGRRPLSYAKVSAVAAASAVGPSVASLGLLLFSSLLPGGGSGSFPLVTAYWVLYYTLTGLACIYVLRMRQEDG